MNNIAALLTDNFDIWTTAIERGPGAGRGGSKRLELYGIERLRALIFDLAVRGRLVPQDPDDEPASVILRRAKSEKARLIGLGAASRSKPLVAPTDWPFVIPANWAWTLLGDVTNYGDAEKVNPGDEPPQTWVLELEDVEKRTSRLLRRVRYSDRPFQSQKNRFRPGDVVYGKLRPYLDKVIIADEAGVCTTEMVPMRGYVGLMSEYLRLFLKSPFFIDLATEASHGMNLPRLGTERARAAPFALPPLAEQRRIVSKTDELIALCDVLELETAGAMAAHEKLVEYLLVTLTKSANAVDFAANWARIEEHFDTLITTPDSVDALKQTILELAVKGRLNANHEADRPFKALGDYVVDAAAGWSPKCIETPRSEGRWGVLKVSAVTWGRFQPEENKELPPSLEPRLDIEVRPGDFLISRANTSDLVARSVVVPEGAPRRLMMSDKIIRFRFNDQLDPEYVNLIHASPYARDYYARVAGGTSSSMKNVSQAQIRALRIPVPTLAEQKLTVALVYELMVRCDALALRINDVGTTQKQLADVVVVRAAA